MPWDGIKSNRHLNRGGWYAGILKVSGLVCGAMSLTTAGNCSQSDTTQEQPGRIVAAGCVEMSQPCFYSRELNHSTTVAQ
jgi:hypothetical protein